jgi:hypothetical protein
MESLRSPHSWALYKIGITMLDVISTSISSVGLLIQLYDRHGPKKVGELEEYKSGLREIVSSLHFSKNMHAVAHELMDSQCTAIFDVNLDNIGIQDFCNAYRANLGRVYEKHMLNQVRPSLAKYESLVMDVPEQFPSSLFSNQFVGAVASLSQSYPRMIGSYKSLEEGIQIVDEGFEQVSMDISNFHKFAKAYDKNSLSWKSFISHHNRRLLTLADQTILSQITILDELFIV